MITWFTHLGFFGTWALAGVAAVLLLILADRAGREQS